MQILGAFTDFERAMIREHTQAGLKKARAKGRTLGRKPRLAAAQEKEIVAAVSAGRKTAADMARVSTLILLPFRACFQGGMKQANNQIVCSRHILI